MFRLLLTALTLSATALSQSLPLSRVSFYTPYTKQSLSACGPTRGVGQAAVSRDLMRRLHCGARIRVVLASGRSMTLTIWDVTNRRYSRTLDILASSRAQAIRLGITTGTLEVLQAKPNQAGRNARW